MRQLILWALALGLAASASALAPSTSNVFQPVPKPWNEISRQDGVRVQGDTIEDPFIIGAIPFTATGSTCSFVNDYDYACPYTGSTSADVVYKFVPGADMALSVDFCGSIYDTKVYVYANTVGNVIACNDDYCNFQSVVSNVPMVAGNEYYIVVDGYGGSCGTYHLDIATYEPCVIECPPTTTMIEGEPDCYAGYVDSYNGGCNAIPPVFQFIDPTCYGPDPVICGTTGVFQFDTMLYRDTDWFQMDVDWIMHICLGGDAEVPCYFFIIDGRGGCETSTVAAYGVAGPCAPVTDICYLCDEGTWWAWVGPNAWDPGFACGSLYYMTVSGYGGGTPTESTTWGRVKGLFR